MTGCLTGTLRINLLLNGNPAGISGLRGLRPSPNVPKKNGEKQFEAISWHVRDMSLALATLRYSSLPYS